MDATSKSYRPSRMDAVGIIFFIVAGAAIAIWTVVAGILRIIDVLSGRPVLVAIEFVNTMTDAPIGPGGSGVPIQLDRAYVTAAELPAASTVAAVLEQIVFAGTIVTAIACLVLLSRNLLRGRVFSRGNTQLVTGAGLIGLIGFAGARGLENMVANGAIARLSNREFTGNAVLSIEPFPYLLAAFALAIVSTVFIVGDRLQRDTEGLV